MLDTIALAADPYARFGLRPAAPPPTAVPPGVAAAVSTAGINEPPLWSPDHPMFWVAGLILVAVGAAGVSGAVRVGPVRVGGSAGKA